MSFEDYYVKKPISVGPWGGQTGILWDDGVYSTVRQLVIVHGVGIDSIQIEYDSKGSSVWSEKHGGSGGFKTAQVKLDYPDEFLTSIHGHYGSLTEWGPVFVRSLTFESNKKTYGPFGVENGTYFSFPMTGGKIVGFHGKCGWYLDAIGAYLKPLPKPNNPSLPKPNNPLKSMVHSQSYFTNETTEKIGYSIVQGNLGQSYDIVLAVKQNNDNYYTDTLQPNNPSRQHFGSYYVNTLPPNNLSRQHFGSYYVNTLPPNNLSRQHSGSQDSSDSDSKKGKVICNTLPPNSLSRQDSGSQDYSDSESKKGKAPIARMPSIGDGPVTYGPWGGNGGTVFDDGIYTGIKQINLSRNVGIVSIKVLYDQNGEAKWGYKHGGTGGFKSEKIVFDYPYEVLTHITGTSGPAMLKGLTVIKSLTFHTTKGKYGPFGEEQAGNNPFSTNLQRECKIVGFHGKKGLFIDAIGVHVIEGKVVTPQPIHPPSISLNQKEATDAEVDHPQWSNRLVQAKGGQTPEIACGVVKEPAPCGPGPWGGDGGRPWDDGVFSGIKQIFLTRAEAICSIQIEYDRNSQSVWSVKHGGNGGDTTHRVKLDHPHEVLICISGYYGPISRDERSKVIKSLTFITSRATYGPFGEEVGTFFTSTTTEGKVVGFHGRSSLYLDAIGVHMQHWLGHHKPVRSSLFKMFT